MTFTEFCGQFTTEDLPNITKIGKRYYYDPHHTRDLVDEPFSAGIFLGEEKQAFTPTPALIDMLAHNVEKRVVVNEKAAWLFLCGKDVLMESVVETDEFEKGEVAIVADREGNVLGYGEIGKGPYVQHKLDKGEYLRRER